MAGSEVYTLRYYYDANRAPVGFGLQYPTTTYWENYYFAKNVQGDVIALYRSDYQNETTYTGTLIATYEYDPWGRPTSIKNASGVEIAQTASHIANYNPFRYRGYHYDTDTGFYYLKSRYYDPEICRFINADSYASTGQGLIGCNMFTYCNNNPGNMIDLNGFLAKFLPAFIEENGELVQTVAGLLWYVTEYTKKGELYEHWVTGDGNPVHSRHHSDHGNSKEHPVVPHDHEWHDDDKGNNTQDKNGGPPNQGFQAPASNSDSCGSKMTVGAIGFAVFAYGVYAVVKWGVAAFAAPATGGGSLVVAGVMP